MGVIIVYQNKNKLNRDWLEKFVQHCEENNLSAFEFDAKYQFTPLGEDEVSIDPIEVKNFASWKIDSLSSKQELDKLLLEYPAYQLKFIDYQEEL